MGVFTVNLSAGIQVTVYKIQCASMIYLTDPLWNVCSTFKQVGMSQIVDNIRFVGDVAWQKQEHVETSQPKRNNRSHHIKDSSKSTN